MKAKANYALKNKPETRESKQTQNNRAIFTDRLSQCQRGRL